MFPGIGTAINIVAIISGGAFGVLLGARFHEKTRHLITDILGLITLVSGASAVTALWSGEITAHLPQGWPFMVVLGSLLIGGLFGSVLKIEERLAGMGDSLKQKIERSTKSESTFVEGFVAASLVFAVGPLAILGSISDGMSNGIDQLVLKSTLDFFAAVAFAASLGWGVAASALPVGVYQGLWTVIGFFLGSILTTYQVDLMTAVGGILLLGIGLRLLRIREIAIGNILPALFIAPLLGLAIHHLT